MRVLRVADLLSSPPGGANRFMLQSGRALEARGHQIDYLFRDQLWPALGGTGGLRRLTGPPLAAAAVWRRLRSGLSYDVVEINEAVAAAYCLAGRLRPGALPPSAVLSLGTHERAWRAQRVRWRALGMRADLKSRLLVPVTLVAESNYALSHADQALVLNEADRDYLQLELGVGSRRVSRVNTGVAESFFSIEPRTGPVERLLFVGSWGDRQGRDRKGDRELVQAWQQVGKRRELSLSIVGSLAPAEQVLGAFAPDARERVSVHSEASEHEVQEELTRADAFLLPSWFEGMPLATLEAAAAGLPCIVSDIPGHQEVFRPSDPEADGAILVPPHDPVALAEAIERLAADEELAHRLGRNARERARAFTWADTAEQLEAGYLRALGSGRASDKK